MKNLNQFLILHLRICLPMTGENGFLRNSEMKKFFQLGHEHENVNNAERVDDRESRQPGFGLATCSILQRNSLNDFSNCEPGFIESFV